MTLIQDPSLPKPRLSGFTFLRNARELGFPFVESIESILPIVDEFIVVVGESRDDTLSCVRSIASPKIKIIETIWNEKMSSRGFVYAQQKMIGQFACSGEWAFYLEGDEVVHENDLPTIEASLAKHHANPEVEALHFDYLHFYGSPGWLAASPRWYRRECRIIRNTIRTFAPDGQYWVVMENNRKGRYPQSANCNAKIYHYGHVRRQEKMQEKMNQVSKYWNSNPNKVNYADIDPLSLREFKGQHPSVMGPWIENEAELSFTPPETSTYIPTFRERKHRLSMWLERHLQIDLSHKHFREIA